MTTEVQFQEETDISSQSRSDLSHAPIRAQMLWSAFFPLALFGLLTTLVITIAIQMITLNLAVQRNSAGWNCSLPGWIKPVLILQACLLCCKWKRREIKAHFIWPIKKEISWLPQVVRVLQRA
jgi:hypothetical protein